MIESLVEQFAALGDPRCAGKVEHRLVDVLVVAVCAVVAGAETFEDIALYDRCKESWLRRFLELPGGIPSHDTFRRVPMLIDPDAFERCFLTWVREAFSWDPADAPEQIAVDGKAVRHSFDRKRGRSPLHLVSAYATARGLVLAQRAVDDKGGEVAVLPALLDGLHPDGCLISLDALSCRREVAQHIRARGADYLVTLKANQGGAYDEVQAWFAEHAFDRGADLRPCFDAFDDTHGRLVRRRVFVCPDASCFATLRD
jgi:DDE family transposase